MRVRVIISVLFSTMLGLFACSDDKEVAQNNQSEILSFEVEELEIDFAQDAKKNWFSKASANDDLTSLTAVFEISTNATMLIGNTPQASGFTKNNFANPINYTVKAEDGSSSNYKVTIYKKATIPSFSIVELPSILFSIENQEITATVPNGTDISNLTAQFELTEGAKLLVSGTEQVSGTTSNDFTSPVIYTLQEVDGEETSYTVTITEAANETPVANAGEDKVIIVNQGATLTTVTLDASNSTDTEGAINSFEWKNGSETIATTETAQIDLNIGIHTITLTVTDQQGAMDSDEVVITVQEAGSYAPIDSNATEATKNLLTNLGNVGNSSQFIFGQEFPLSFQQNELSYDLTTSDCKDITGDHPGVYGIDPHYMMYKTANQRQLHIDEAKKAYENGSVVTFDFHQQSKTDHKIYMNDITTATDKSLMYDIVNDNNNARSWFYGELDDILSIINNDLGFPIVFRLFHEMDGDWFWWGTKATNHSAQLYIDFYKLTVDYIKERTDLVLFAWSSNYDMKENYYPGDNYVDVVGFDIYEPNKATLKANLIELSTFAVNHNKVAALTETGYRNDYINTKPGFWNDVVLDAIKEGGSEIRIAWVLSWFNAPWTSQQKDLFIPNSDSPQNAKDEFILFKNDNTTLFESDVKSLNIYQ